MMVSVAKTNLKLRLIQFAAQCKTMKSPKFFYRFGKMIRRLRRFFFVVTKPPSGTPLCQPIPNLSF